MSDDTTPPDGAEMTGPLAGERLAAARRDQELSLREIAKELHLDETKVQALEQNQFDVLGAPVFAKGHLRKYAELVGVPVDEVLADYDSLNRSAGPPLVVAPPRKASRDIDLSRYLIPAVAVLLIGGGLVWWFAAGSPLPGRQGAESTPATNDIEFIDPSPELGLDLGQSEDADPELEPVEALPVSEDVETPSAAGDGASGAVPAETPASAPVTPAPTPSQVTLAMNYTGDCWTEVTDASGSRLFFDLGRTGRTINVSGSPPLRVLFGNADNVTVAVNGEAYAIPASARRGETARFTINAP